MRAKFVSMFKAVADFARIVFPRRSNALRQARAAGTYLVVGLIGDDDIVRNKGSPPVMPMSERLIALKSCKFVDEVIEYGDGLARCCVEGS